MTQKQIERHARNRLEDLLEQMDVQSDVRSVDGDTSLLDTPIEFMSSPEFEQESFPTEWLLDDSALPIGQDNDTTRQMPAYFKDISRYQLLDREQEADLFRKMNYYRFLAENLRKDGSVDRSDRLVGMRKLLRLSDQVKEQLVTSNLRLVIALAKRFATPQHTIDDLASDGNLTLLRAVEKFDYSRGNKFSTYATWALRNTFVRLVIRRGKNSETIISARRHNAS